MFYFIYFLKQFFQFYIIFFIINKKIYIITYLLYIIPNIIIICIEKRRTIYSVQLNVNIFLFTNSGNKSAQSQDAKNRVLNFTSNLTKLS